MLNTGTRSSVARQNFGDWRSGSALGSGPRGRQFKSAIPDRNWAGGSERQRVQFYERSE